MSLKCQNTQCWMGVFRQISGHEEMGLNMDQEYQESAQGEVLELRGSRSIPGGRFSSLHCFDCCALVKPGRFLHAFKFLISNLFGISVWHLESDLAGHRNQSGAGRVTFFPSCLLPALQRRLNPGFSMCEGKINKQQKERCHQAVFPMFLVTKITP